MKKSKWFVVIAVWLTAYLSMSGIADCAAEEKTWDISFLGTLKVPAQLEIVDAKDVITEIGKISEKIEKENVAKGVKPAARIISPQEVIAALEKNHVGIYELALKNKGSYNTAFVITFKFPREFEAAGVNFFDSLQKMDKNQQAEVHKQILAGMDTAYAKIPDLKGILEMEILEFYPFEQMTNANAEMISVGGSVAFRMYKIIEPAAVKVYFIKKNKQFYVFGLINSGQDRKLWEDMTKKMLSDAQWKITLD